MVMIEDKKGEELEHEESKIPNVLANDSSLTVPKPITQDKKELDLAEFDQILADIPKQIDAMEEPVELISQMNKKQKKEYDKDKNKWMTKLKSKYYTDRITEILNLKKAYNKSQSEIEKDFIYKPGFMEMLGTKILKRNYLRIMMIMPNGVMKEFSKPIKTNYVKLMKGRYVIQLSAMIKFKGKNTLFYHHGNPFPLTFDSDKYPYIVNAESLENMFNSNIVSQIFAGLSMGKALLWGFGAFAGIAMIIAASLLFGPAAVKEATSSIILGGNIQWLRTRLNKKI